MGNLLLRWCASGGHDEYPSITRDTHHPRDNGLAAPTAVTVLVQPGPTPASSPVPPGSCPAPPGPLTREMSQTGISAHREKRKLDKKKRVKSVQNFKKRDVMRSYEVVKEEKPTLRLSSSKMEYNNGDEKPALRSSSSKVELNRKISRKRTRISHRRTSSLGDLPAPGDLQTLVEVGNPAISRDKNSETALLMLSTMIKIDSAVILA